MKNLPPDIEGFAPIAADKPRILILGTMPGEVSLQQRQYYGHARNAFWPIMIDLFGTTTSYDYEQLQNLLTANGIALWDILKSCQRQGSLDANINRDSMLVNDFLGFFKRYRDIRRVFFNGSMAEALYKRHILKKLPLHLQILEYHKLPSTSPANASYSFAQKLDSWRLIRHMVSEQSCTEEIL